MSAMRSKVLHERYGCYFVAMTQGARGALAYVEGEFFASRGISSTGLSRYDGRR